MQDHAVIKVNGRPVILHRKTRIAKFRAGLIKDWGRGFAMLCNWAWVCLPKTEWDRYPEPIDLAEHLPDEGPEGEAFVKAVSSLFADEEKGEPAGNGNGGASSPSPASPSESAAPSGSV